MAINSCRSNPILNRACRVNAHPSNFGLYPALACASRMTWSVRATQGLVLPLSEVRSSYHPWAASKLIIAKS